MFVDIISFFCEQKKDFKHLKTIIDIPFEDMCWKGVWQLKTKYIKMTGKNVLASNVVNDMIIRHWFMRPYRKNVPSVLIEMITKFVAFYHLFPSSSDLQSLYENDLSTLIRTDAHRLERTKHKKGTSITVPLMGKIYWSNSQESSASQKGVNATDEWMSQEHLYIPATCIYIRIEELETPGDIWFGLINSNFYKDEKLNKDKIWNNFRLELGNENSYAIFGLYGSTRHNWRTDFDYYSKGTLVSPGSLAFSDQSVINAGDCVGIKVALDPFTKKCSLSFQINDIDLGEAFCDVQNGPWHFAVMLKCSTKLEIVKTEQFFCRKRQ
ncbi:hypothetical protein RFI_16862 [Reticulomyxa filosa]|uniref:SPRY domain-containing protein n=1 Tax=Reticulomyxa filosa TaxID=46433 RepID=X6N263_RETFI|nr:hypothetical protein RFI_16862 [Reticulomyxa filosa]|eukprot:ETO20355.1 hypothetical protein RFI_16862 [Reticulomyxa filosa]